MMPSHSQNKSPKWTDCFKEAKQAIQSSLDHDLQTGLTKEYEAYLRLIHTEDRLEGLKAFQEKRTPYYRDRK